MSSPPDPVDVVRAIYAAVAAGDHERTRSLLSPDLRWRQAGSAVPAAGEDVVGADALIERVIRPLEDEWTGFTEDVEEVVGVDGRVVGTGTYRGHHLATGRDLAAEFCHLWQVRDGVAVAFRQYTDTAAFRSVLTEESSGAP